MIEELQAQIRALLAEREELRDRVKNAEIVIARLKQSNANLVHECNELREWKKW